jgi:hypothetical protein
MRTALEYLFALVMLPFMAVALLVVLMLIGAERLIDGDER